MRIWVDADACPHAVKGILFRAADRVRVLTTLVSRAPLRVPPSPFIEACHVAKGVERADDRIARELSPGDLVITADVRLAAAAIARGARALDPRGELYAEDTMRERLAMRSLVQALRSGGTLAAGSQPFRQGDEHAFADQLDRVLGQAS